uniref:Serotransferrin n=1 Tax=Sphaeramia orbicularis TaxID=375764 RepID=A0A673BD05_9TELE
ANGEADFVSADGGEVFTAGKCGLVPVMAEQYDENTAFSYYAVAVVKKGSQVTWQNLQGKRSCHTGIGRTAGWNVPMSHIYNQTNECNFTQFFSSGCAPGADPSSPFCKQCAGIGEDKCSANDDEPYYGYTGAFKCLVEDSGDVAFIKHTTVPENADGNGPDFSQSLSSADFELICPGSQNPVPVTEFASCNLARVPAHAVISHPENRTKIVGILQELQNSFGPNGTNTRFRIFKSEGGRNLLFKDSTKCLQEVQTNNFESFLGNEYINAVRSLRQCTANTPGLYFTLP